MLNHFSKRGTILVFFTAIAFLVTVIFLIHDAKTLQPVGMRSLQILDDVSVARKVEFYVQQSLRNAALAGLQDLQREGFFPSQVAGKTCPLVQSKPLLFTDISCSYTRKTLDERYLTFVRQRFAPFFSQQLYGLSFTTADFPFTMTSSQQGLLFSGVSAHSFSYTGKQASYSFSITYDELISYDLHHFFTLMNSVQKNLSCIKQFAAQPEGPTESTFGQQLLQQCSFSKEFIWAIEKQGDLLFITATTKDPVLFLDNLSFAFAISLNNLQIPREDTHLF